MLQSFQDFAADGRNLAFGHNVECHNISETASFHVFHNNPEFAATKIAINEVDNIGMRAFLHDQDFVNNQILFRLLLKIHLLNSNQAIATSLIASVNTTRSTLANLCESSKDLPGVAVSTYSLELRSHVDGRTLPLTRARSCLRIGRLRFSIIALASNRGWYSSSISRGAAVLGPGIGCLALIAR